MRYDQLEKRQRSRAHMMFQRGQIDRYTFGLILNRQVHIGPQGRLRMFDVRLWAWRDIGRIWPVGTFKHRTAPRPRKKARTAPKIAQH